MIEDSKLDSHIKDSLKVMSFVSHERGPAAAGVRASMVHSSAGAHLLPVARVNPQGQSSSNRAGVVGRPLRRRLGCRPWVVLSVVGGLSQAHGPVDEVEDHKEEGEYDQEKIIHFCSKVFLSQVSQFSVLL